MKRAQDFAGFERLPSGKLLEQILDLDAEMGLAYERAIGFEKAPHVHERHMIVCPRGPCRMVVGNARERITIDSTKVLWVPRNLEHDDEGQSAIYDTFALFPSGAYVDAMIREAGLAAAELARLETEMIVLRRSRWLDEILERYFYERVLNPEPPPGCTFFLEKQILHELVRLAFADKLHDFTARTRIGAEPGPLDRALRYIESNLFAELDVKVVARVAKISESTLLRLFKHELAQTPAEYVRNRRLDEALLLLRRGDHRVGDVAMLVGYEDLSAFSKAFRKRFGESPTSAAVARGTRRSR